jgi:hypothetical protein
VSDAEPSHREGQLHWPDPLGRAGPWTWGAWALPAAALSAASAAAFAIVFLYLAWDSRLRSLFVLHRWTAAGWAAASAVLAWLVVVRCRRRPGRRWPRRWALLLALLASGSCALALLRPSPWVHCLVVAGFAAALTLAPRLLKLHPDSRWVQRIAPLSLLAVLLLALPAAGMVRHSIAESEQAEVEAAIGQFRQWTAEVKEVTGHQWHVEEEREAAAQAVRKLAAIRAADRVEDADLWRAAEVLDRGGELTGEAQALAAAVVAGFSAGAPRLSLLKAPAIQQVPGTSRFEENAILPAVSDTVGLYHQELGRLFAELSAKSGPAGEDRLALEKSCADRVPELRQQLGAEMNRWADGWAVFRVPGHAALLGRSKVPLWDLLRESLLDAPPNSAEAAWQAADLPAWFGLGYGVLQKLQGRLPGCLPLGPYREKNKPGKLFYRLDCDSYSPRREGAGAEPRVQMRLVYMAIGNRALAADQRPSEMDFYFPVPDGQAPESFEGQVTTDLKNAVGSVPGLAVMFAPDTRAHSVRSFRVTGRGLVIGVRIAERRLSLGSRQVLQVRAAVVKDKQG